MFVWLFQRWFGVFSLGLWFMIYGYGCFTSGKWATALAFLLVSPSPTPVVHARPFVGVSHKSIFKRPCQLLAIDAHKMASRTTQWLQERPWNAPTKGLLWNLTLRGCAGSVCRPPSPHQLVVGDT